MTPAQLLALKAKDLTLALKLCLTPTQAAKLVAALTATRRPA